MIDFHSHILPKMDDGSRSVEESLRLLRVTAAQGIEIIAATPHFYARRDTVNAFLQRRDQSWKMLRASLEPDMPEIRLGAEVEYFEGISVADSLWQLCIEGTSILLLEMPFYKWNDRMIKSVISLNDSPGITVLLAHIERYIAMQDKRTLDILIDEGILIQSNASFFTERKTKKKALRMLEGEKIHLLGSDCHNMDSRPQTLGEAVELIKSSLGERFVTRINNRGRSYMI